MKAKKQKKIPKEAIIKFNNGEFILIAHKSIIQGKSSSSQPPRIQVSFKILALLLIQQKRGNLFHDLKPNNLQYFWILALEISCYLQ